MRKALIGILLAATVAAPMYAAQAQREDGGDVDRTEARAERQAERAERQEQRSERQLYGRRVGRPLSSGLAASLETALPAMRLNVDNAPTR